MSDIPDRISRAITRFVENPVTDLVKGIVLFLIGLSEASKTFTDDLKHKQLRVGHGLIIIGVFGILGAVPHLINGLEAGLRYHERRGKKARPDPGTGVGPEKGDDRAH
jgi:hypothetical protein